MDRIYPKSLADIKIEGVIWVKQMLWAVKDRAKMISKEPSSFDTRVSLFLVHLWTTEVDSINHTDTLVVSFITRLWDLSLYKVNIPYYPYKV